MAPLPPLSPRLCPPPDRGHRSKRPLPSRPVRLLDLEQQLHAIGAKPVHAQRILRLWTQALPDESCKRKAEDYFPSACAKACPPGASRWKAWLCCSQHPADDGSSRLLVQLGDGQVVESVLLPRGGLCVSTQVGCAVGCVFCMTGGKA